MSDKRIYVFPTTIASCMLLFFFQAAHRRSLFILISFATFVLSLILICLAMRARQARMSLITACIMQYNAQTTEHIPTVLLIAFQTK